jgi:hypothetical protein
MKGIQKSSKKKKGGTFRTGMRRESNGDFEWIHYVSLA